MASDSSQSVGERDRSLASTWRTDFAWPLLTSFSVLAIGAFCLLIAPTVIMAPWDMFILLDGGWRIFNGEIPHNDYYTPIGPLVYWLSAAGMYVAGPSLKAVSLGILFFLGVAAPWAMTVFFRKLPGYFAFLLALFLVLLIVATRPLGYSPSTTTYAMIYNRYGWVLISILMVQLFLRNQEESRTAASFDAVSAGALLALLFICKVSFFVVGFPALVLACILRPELRRVAWKAACSFGAVCFLAWLVTGINPQDYLKDLSFAAKSQSLGLRFLWLKNSLHANVVPVLLLALCWFLLVAAGYWRKTITLADAIRCSIVFWFLLAGGMFITVGNASERSDVPLFLVTAVILFVGVSRSEIPMRARDGGTRTRFIHYGFAAAVIAFFFVGTAGKDALSLANTYFAGERQKTEPDFSEKFDAPYLSDFTIPADSQWQTAYSRAGEVPSRINEGLELLRRHVAADDQVVTLALTDPFSFALDLVPAKGAPLWWDLGISFTRKNYPSPETVFANADYVIYPLTSPQAGCCQETVTTLLDLYGGFLGEHFTRADASAHWVLLRRR
ncbi:MULTISPECIES: hypothetical protein [unclassified Sinorhizobium]|uniref:hypothetical protein n=1 Tax=unclassified Sinorhizobium TaxID=2613772 RepID=UPI0035264162